MNFELSEEQQLLAETPQALLANDYNFDARGQDHRLARRLERGGVGGLAEMGLLGLPFAEEHGGFGGSAVDVMLVMEAIGEGLVVEPYLATVGAGRPVRRPRRLARRSRSASCPRSSQGKHTLAFAHTEPGARYDLAPGRRCAPAARATASCSTATSAWCCTAAAADTLVVSARTAGGDTDAARHQPVPGRSRTRARRHRQGVPHASTSCAPPTSASPACASAADALLGREGAGLPADRGGRRLRHRAPLRRGGRRHPLRQRRHARVPEDAPAVRRADRQLPGAAAPHGRHGDQLRAGALDGLPRVREGRHARTRPSAGTSISAAKIKIADACRHVSQEAVQLHGGMGMTEELKVSHTFRRLTMIAQTFGDAEHHLERFAATDTVSHG